MKKNICFLIILMAVHFCIFPFNIVSQLYEDVEEIALDSIHYYRNHGVLPSTVDELLEQEFNERVRKRNIELHKISNDELHIFVTENGKHFFYKS